MQVAAALSSRRLLWGSWRTLVCAEGLQWRGLAAAADTNAAAAEVKAEGAAPAAKIHAACVLERLPVVQPPPPDWYSEYQAQWRLDLINRKVFKQYPEYVQADESSADQRKQVQARIASLNPVPRTTHADETGDKKTMKRQLEQRLYLMVKRKSSGGWGFPAAENSASESIRQTADRALTATIGRRHPIYPIGNAPMGHLVSQADGSSTYFLLSQVVDDPWVVALSAAADAADYAWLTKAELLAADGGYVRDARLRELLSKMLAA